MDVFVVSGVRTAIGDFGGSLKDITPAALARDVVAEAVRRGGIAPADVGHLVFGQVIHTEARDMYISRVAAIDAGLPQEVPALTVNRLCGSGLQAVI
jgi:acetyl-CoA C-acetyltransferase